MTTTTSSQQPRGSQNHTQEDGARPGSRKPLVLVTGATDQLGSAVMRALLAARRCRVRALLPDARASEPTQARVSEWLQLGAEVVSGDFARTSPLGEAMRGVDTVFSVQADDDVKGADETEGGYKVVKAALNEGVKHLIYSSIGSAHLRTGIPHFENKAVVEAYIRASGVPYTILRPVFFYYHYLHPLMAASLARGYFAHPLPPDCRLQQLCEDDYARLVACIASEPGAFARQEIDVAGCELSMQETVAQLSAALGHPVAYAQTSWEEFRDASSEGMYVMYQWLAKGGYQAVPSYLQQVVGCLTPLHTYMARHWPRRQQSA